ncbi:MAG TPA: hypothetical protein VLG69_02440 [Candidatus Andersenbacteria bacterium]|nr:hypothetical protein [Candidatus Andersenbacteria bacterium]
MMRNLMFVIMLLSLLAGCDQANAKKQKPATRQEVADLANEIADARALAIQAKAAASTDEFKKLGTQIYIGEGDNAMMLTVPKDKNGRHQRLSDMRFTVLREAARLREEPDGSGNKCDPGLVPPPTLGTQ